MGKSFFFMWTDSGCKTVLRIRQNSELNLGVLVKTFSNQVTKCYAAMYVDSNVQ